MAQAAFFDLDKTVIAKSSTLAFGKPLFKAGFLRRRALLRAAFGQLFYQLFGADQATLERARDQMLRMVAGWQADEVEQTVEEALAEIAAPYVYAEALFLIDEHKREGRRVFLVSASPDVVVRPLARYVEVDEVIATRIKTDAQGRFLPELELYAQGEGKAVAMREVAAEQGIDLDGSFAYTDSATDLPMLEAVGHPVAVNPERDLRKLAEEREWPILEFQRQVRPAGRFSGPVPIISGATITAAAAAAVTWALLRRSRS